MRRAATLLGLVACGDGGSAVVGDGFPIRVDISSGPVIAQIREGDGPAIDAVIDVLAPFTVLDAPFGETASRRGADLTLLGDSAAGLVPRAHLALTVLENHPCEDAGDCTAGPVGAPVPVGAVIGADAFASGAVRFDLAAGHLALFKDISGSTISRGRLCEVEVRDPFHGGGTLVFPGGAQVEFDARRIAVGACLSYRDGADGPSDRGADVQLVLSTGVGPTILSQSAYERWAAVAGGAAVDGTPGDQVLMVGGPVTGWARQIDRLALVGRSDRGRGPCQQVAAHHLVVDDACEDNPECPCDSAFCQVPGILELAPDAPLDVLVVPDDDPTIQALRAELRPESAEVDGILGTAALASVSFDVDTPHDRVLLRCEATGCTARPELITNTDAARACLDRVPDADAPDAGAADAAPPDAAPIDAGP